MAEYNESTGEWEYAENYDEETGQYTPKASAAVTKPLNISDIKNRVPYRIDTSNPWYPEIVADSNAQAPTDPNAYYTQLSSDLANAGFREIAINADPSRFTNLLEGLKTVNPQAYYTGQISLLSQQAGLQAVGSPGNEAVYQQQLQQLLPEALKAGVSTQQVNSLYGTGFAQGGQQMQTIINNKGGGSWWSAALPALGIFGGAIGGAALCGAFSAAGAAGAGAAGAGAATSAVPAWVTAAGKGALVGGGLGGVNAALGGGNIGRGVLTGVATGAVGGGIGNAFGGGTLGNISGGTLAGGAGAAIRGGNIGRGALLGGVGGAINAGLNSLTNPSTSLFSSNTPINADTIGTTKMEEFFGPTYADLGYDPYVGPTYQELGYTGLDVGQMGPSYAELGMTGFNTEEAITAADAAAAAAQGISGSTLTSLAKQYGLPAVKALLGGGNTKGKGIFGTDVTLGDALGGLLGGGTSLALTSAQRKAIQDAYATQSRNVSAATAQAQNLASFTPIGTTNFFGSSQFTRDPVTGQLTSAGFTPTSQVQGQLQNLFGLGAEALPTTANTQDIQQQYIAQQQALLAPGREQQLAQLKSREFGRGTSGLATGGTSVGYTPGSQGLMAANPAMQAYYNSLAQQDAQLAARAPTYAQELLNAQINTGTGLFGAANTLQGYAQQPLTLSTDLAKAQAAAGANAGQLGLTGNMAAARLGAEGTLLGNAAMTAPYNKLGQTAGGLGQNIGNFLYNNPTIQSWLS
jgi:hypothetical protein